MFADGRSLSDGAALESEVCIVGAGAAGIALARELAGAPFRVTLVESGGFEPDPVTQELYAGAVTGAKYPPLHTARLRFFGGTTNHWEGRMRPFEPQELRERPWVPHSGWPFDRAHLDPYYARAARLCGLASPLCELAELERESGGTRLPLDPSRVRTTCFAMRPARFGRLYREELRRAKNVRVLLHSNVLELETDAEASAVQRARVRCIPGNEFRVAARVFVLALGGIENPRLLLLSNRARPAGLGNAHDLVGRYFAEHPLTRPGVWLLSDPALDLRLYAPGRRGMAWLSLAPGLARRERIGHYTAALLPIPRWVSPGEASWDRIFDDLGDGELPDDFARHVRNVARDFDRVAGGWLDGLRGLFGQVTPERAVALIPSTEMAPDPESRVRLGAERDRFGQPRVELRLRYGELDRRTVVRGTELLGLELARAGLGRVRPRMEEDAMWAGAQTRYHHMGTTRMHADPRRGVVDPDCRVHGVSNLYVAGSSVFPTGGAGVPTLTLLALALRLADHIRTQLG